MNGTVTGCRRLLMIAATGNAHKVGEFRAILDTVFDGAAPEVLSQKDIAALAGTAYAAPPEDGHSFAENAYIKSAALERFVLASESVKAYCARYDAVCVVADDSGLCVDVLGGRPGIYSARYAAPEGSTVDASDAENVDKLLRELDKVPDRMRSARFSCHISALLRFGADFSVRKRIETAGDLKGMIARARSGRSGFGYDPVMYLPEFGMTVAELEPGQKNGISHRGKALRAAAGEIYGCIRKL